MSWTVETKMTDVAPRKRGEDWSRDVCHIIRDELGRYVVSLTEQDRAGLPAVFLSPAETQSVVRLFAAAPDLRDALQSIVEGAGDAWSIDIARAALEKARGEA